MQLASGDPLVTDERDPQITALGTAGEFVVVWTGLESENDKSIFVQKFLPNGMPSGNGMKLEAIGNLSGADDTPQVSEVGNFGEFVVTWSGVDSAGDSSVFIQNLQPTAV